MLGQTGLAGSNLRAATDATVASERLHKILVWAFGRGYTQQIDWLLRGESDSQPVAPTATDHGIAGFEGSHSVYLAHDCDVTNRIGIGAGPAR